jgi:hypothetical protein
MVVLILAEALMTRTGWKLPQFAGWRRASVPAKLQKAPQAKPVSVPEPTLHKDEETPPVAPSERSSRFQRAKNRK